MILRIAFSLLLLLSLRASFAEHLPGGSITYTCLGGNFFEVKLSLLRECSGFPMIAQQLKFTNSCGVVFNVSNLPPVLVENPMQLCEAEMSNSTCAGGVLPGYELYEFTTELYLSPCNFWTISWSICCRQPSVNVQSIPGLYIETKIDNIADACNNSPVFHHNGVPRVCMGQPVNYDAGATDVDGTRLEYSLIDARFASPFPVSVNYVFPNHGGEPIAGMALDTHTGQITFTPADLGYIIVAVQIDEYNENDQWIGSVMRDFPFIVTACDNLIPSPDSGIITAASGGATSTGDRAMVLCSSSEACITIEFSDPNAAQQLSIWTNAAQVIEGASVETTGTNPLAVNICWDEVTTGPGSYFFVITVMDDACPIMGARSYVYTVELNESPYAGMDGSALACELALPFTLIDSLEGTPPMGGVWTDPQGASHGGFFNGDTDIPGIYTYTFTEDGCSGSAELELIFLPEDDSLCISLNVQSYDIPLIKVFPNPTNGQMTVQGFDHHGAPIALYDLQGRSVLIGTSQGSGDTIHLTLPGSLCNGVYLLQGVDRDGNSHVLRIIVER